MNLATFRILTLALALPGWGSGVAFAQRLPTNVLPDHYRLRFEPDFAQNRFSGEETIGVRLLQPASSITLNAAAIQFLDATITSGATTQAAQVSADAKREMATLTVAHEIPAGPARIQIRFGGILNDQLRGLYRSQAGGRKYAFTQFEATDARRAFPCFDEPTMKARFDLSVVAPQGATAISNGRIVSDVPGPGLEQHTIVFSTTPRMSSYLVALAVGKLACTEGAAEGVPIRVCATPENIHLGKFALEAAEGFLRYYNRYYSLPYPFGKLDLVAVPDFAAGAMENTAAIFFRESALLLDARTASLGARERVAETIAHEMAHLWFGDLVTMRWWDNVWLNEGFATWMSAKAVEAWKPQWKTAEDAAASTDAALNADSIADTRPIRARRAETPAEINELFDAIAYSKTAAVLRMTESYVGEGIFRQGVNRYLQEHAYSNATPEDFWNTLAQVSGRPLNDVMASFVDQRGAPLVSVETRCDGGKTAVTLSQRRYSFDQAQFDAGTDELWRIPVCLKQPGGPSAGAEAPVRCMLLTDKRQTFELGGCAPWVFADAGGRGYYRMEYGPQAAAEIARAAERDLAPQERVALLASEWALVRVNRGNVGDYLALVRGFRQDPSPAVLEAAMENLEGIGRDLTGDSDRELYRQWVRRLLGPLAEQLGWQPAADENPDRRELRATVLGVLGNAGRDPEVLSRARAMVERALRQPDAVDPSLAGTLVRLAALEGDQALYDQYRNKVRSAETPEEHNLYLFTLARFSDPALLQQTLAHALSAEVRSQDAFILIAAALRNPAGRQVAWGFVKEHWAEIQEKLPPFAGRAIVGATRDFCDAAEREDVRQFFTAHPTSGTGRALRETVETINYCIALRAQQQGPLDEWLRREHASAGRPSYEGQY